MPIDFERSAYLSAFREYQEVWDDREITRHVRKQGFGFEVESVSYWGFNSRFRSDFEDLPCYLGYCVQPLVALPLVAWCAVAKTVYHLALILFDAIFTMFCMPPSSDYASYVQAQCFYLVRDLQESFGWLISIFHESYGMYHVAEADFQKSCYDCFLVDEQKDDPGGYLIRQADNYIISGDLEKALETTFLWGIDGANLNRLVKAIAQRYCERGDVDRALSAISRITSHQERDDSTFEVAERLLEKGDRSRALKTIRRFKDIEKVNPFLVKVALSYESSRNTPLAKEVIEEVIKNAFEDSMRKNGSRDRYEKIVGTYPQKVKEYFGELAENCYQIFREESEGDFLNQMRSMGGSPRLWQEFFAIDTHAQVAHETSNNGGFGNFKHYQVLGLPTTATKEEVRKKYKKLAATAHPDKVQQRTGEDDQSFLARKQVVEDKFKEIAAAHTALTH